MDYPLSLDLDIATLTLDPPRILQQIRHDELGTLQPKLVEVLLLAVVERHGVRFGSPFHDDGKNFNQYFYRFLRSYRDIGQHQDANELVHAFMHDYCESIKSPRTFRALEDMKRMKCQAARLAIADRTGVSASEIFDRNPCWLADAKSEEERWIGALRYMAACEDVEGLKIGLERYTNNPSGHASRHW